MSISKAKLLNFPKYSLSLFALALLSLLICQFWRDVSTPHFLIMIMLTRTLRNQTNIMIIYPPNFACRFLILFIWKLCIATSVFDSQQGRRTYWIEFYDLIQLDKLKRTFKRNAACCFFFVLHFSISFFFFLNYWWFSLNFLCFTPIFFFKFSCL